MLMKFCKISKNRLPGCENLVTPEQCRMARAGLNWSRAELARQSGVAEATIAGFESETRSTYPRTVRDLQAALVKGGAVFNGDGVSIKGGREV